MHEVKILEIRDKKTFMPMMAIKFKTDTSESERFLVARAGYGCMPHEQYSHVILMRLDGGELRGSCDPYGHGGARTLQVAHTFIVANWHNIEPGAVIDVEYILNETSKIKVSERIDDLQISEGE